MPVIPLAGLVPFTTLDYPGALAAVLFSQGCPWRCGYCQNSHLQPLEKGSISWGDVMAFLLKRKGLLDAVVFSGGEPTLHKDLASCMRQVKEMGYKIGLHTAGIFPQLLKPILSLIDWVGMDIKAPFEDYEKITKVPKTGEKARQSAELILASGVGYEFRTTVHPKLLTIEDLNRLTSQLVQIGAKHFVLQRFRSRGCSDDQLTKPPFDEAWSESFLLKLGGQFESFLVR